MLEQEKDITFSASLLDWLAQELKIEDLGSQNISFLQIASEFAPFQYALAVHEEKCFVAVDYSKQLDKFLGIQYPVDILKSISIDSESIGSVTGQFCTTIRQFPFSLIIKIAKKLNAKRIIITGKFLSGSIAHQGALILRKICESIDIKVPITCISFSGPLCGTPALHQYLREHHAHELHLTVNINSSVIDRLLVAYQQLSALTHSEVDSWRQIYETLNSHIRFYFSSPQNPNSDVTKLLHSLESAETALFSHPLYTGDAVLDPIGSYSCYNWSTTETQEHPPTPTHSLSLITTSYSSDILPMLEMLHRLGSWVDTPLHVLYLHSLGQPQQKGREYVPPTDQLSVLLPTITGVQIKRTGQESERLTFVFHGSNLDTALQRQSAVEIPLTDETLLTSLPIHIHTTTQAQTQTQQGSRASTPKSTSANKSKPFSLLPLAKVIYTGGVESRLVVEVVGLTILSDTTISIRNDFGESNSLPLSPNDIQTVPPSSYLHPTMNAHFLASALLRVAVCYRECGFDDVFQNRYPELYRIWRLLLAVEGIFNYPVNPKMLEIQTLAYVNGQFDIVMLRNKCMERMEMMAKQVTEFQDDENVILHGARTVAGYSLLVLLFIYMHYIKYSKKILIHKN
jgi:hypothetical protein